MKTTIFVCPFAQFGNPGTQAGAQLVADALREMLDDVEHERRPQRAKAYRGKVVIEELPMMTPDDVNRWRDRATAIAKRALDRGDFLIWIGGNHLSVMPLYEELGRRPGSLVVQADAHLDVYHHDDTISELSHGNFIRHLDPAPEIVNIGHRDLFLPRKQISRWFSAAHGIEAMQGAFAAIGEAAAGTERTLLDIDWDVLDPAYFPAVDDSLPFGLTPQQLLELLDAIWSGRLVGVAMSEFDPGRDVGDRSLGLTVWFIESILLRLYERA